MSLRLRHPAGRIVSPVAVQADDTPLHAEGSSDHSGILGDRVIDWARFSVVDESGGGAEPAWDRVFRPWPPSRFTHPVKSQDAERRIPKLIFPFGKPLPHLCECGRIVAERHNRVVTRSAQPKIQFQ